MSTTLNATTTVLITGAAGTLGKRLIPLLREAGARVRAISRRGGKDHPGLSWIKGDINDPVALQQAMDSVDVVVHLATNAQKTGADLKMGRAVVMAAHQANIQRLVYMSIVSLERMPGAAYCREKLAVEQLVEESGLPYTILRATQFHELVAQIIGMLTIGPVSLVPKGVELQPVDANAVAQRLAELTLSEAAGRVRDVCGPEGITFDQLARSYHLARGSRKRVLSVSMPLPLFKAWRGGAALASHGQVVGRTWNTWCDLARPANPSSSQQA